jgi:hypothetical protein
VEAIIREPLFKRWDLHKEHAAELEAVLSFLVRHPFQVPVTIKSADVYW